MSEFTKSLGSLADGLSEREITALRATVYNLADSIFEWWLRKRVEERRDHDSRTGLS